MNRLLFATLAGLTLAIGLTVASLAWRVISFDPPISTLEAADPAIGYAFYDGIDQVLAGKPADALEQAVSSGFVDHGGTDNADQSTDQLVDQLIAFRQSFPDTRIVVNGIEAAAGTLVVSIAPVRPSGAMVAGLPLTMEPIAGGYEVLRVRNGRVTERWSNGLPDIELHAFDDVAFSMSATLGRTVRLDRIELPSAGTIKLRTEGESLVMVESGSARIHTSWFDGNAGAQSDVLILNSGQAEKLPSGATIKLESNDDDTARLLRFSMRVVRATDPTPPVATGGATTELLWSSNLPPLGSSGEWSLAVGSLRLPGGTTESLATDDQRLLVACSGGSVRATTRGGEVIALDDHLWPASLGISASFEAGQAVSAEEAATVDLQSDSGAVLWLIALSESGSPATPSPSMPTMGL